MRCMPSNTHPPKAQMTDSTALLESKGNLRQESKPHRSTTGPMDQATVPGEGRAAPETDETLFVLGIGAREARVTAC